MKDVNENNSVSIVPDVYYSLHFVAYLNLKAILLNIQYLNFLKAFTLDFETKKEQ